MCSQYKKKEDLRCLFGFWDLLFLIFFLNDVAIRTSSDGNADELLLTRLNNRLFLFSCHPSIDLGVGCIVDWVAELISELLRITCYRNLHLGRETLLHRSLANRMDPMSVN